MNKENLPQVVKEGLFTRIGRWLKNIIGKNKKENIVYVENDVVENTQKQDFVSNIKIQEDNQENKKVKILQKELKDKKINASDLSDKEIKQIIELYKNQIKHKQLELKRYRKNILT